ncbi:hypothetical protein JTE90_007039 [Oedothorax gibbosus]|uniref:Uncharacterized protein n=1 Tax=Oedothorax gibbosus TaxID=931172 RepID=A0AAV6U8E7_9ARAC|nr:hypothetical protein JTE90_007039 [Oedothorax gibbosus]
MSTLCRTPGCFKVSKWKVTTRLSYAGWSDKSPLGGKKLTFKTISILKCIRRGLFTLSLPSSLEQVADGWRNTAGGNNNAAFIPPQSQTSPSSINADLRKMTNVKDEAILRKKYINDFLAREIFLRRFPSTFLAEENLVGFRTEESEYGKGN